MPGALRAPGAEAHLGAADPHRRRRLLPDRRAPAAVRATRACWSPRAPASPHVPRRQRAGLGTPGAAARAAGRRQRARWPTPSPRCAATSCCGRCRADAAAEIRRIRQRMEAELAHEDERAGATSRPAAAGCSTSRASCSSCSSATSRRIRSCSRSIASAPRSRRLARLGLLAPRGRRDAARGLGVPAAPVEPPAHRREPLDLRPRRGARRSRWHRHRTSATRSPQRAGGARRALLEDYRRHTDRRSAPCTSAC